MVEENQKPSELLDTELGMTLMMWRLWSTSRSIGQMSAVWYGNGPGKNPSCRERKRVMAVLESQDYLHDFPTLGKSKSEVVTILSATKLLAWVSMHSACCQCNAWSSAMWEGGAHCSGKIISISPEASISHATGKDISHICSIHYSK